MKNSIPKPETQLNVLKRYLHVLALLQNSRDSAGWNATSLADLLSLDETDDPLSDKTIRDYIHKNIVEEMGIDVTTGKGRRTTRIVKPLEKDIHCRLAGIYSYFIAVDDSKDIVLKDLIKKHPEDALWFMARLYFAKVERKVVSFSYRPNTVGKRFAFSVHPYHMVFRNNNLYLAGKNEYRNNVSLFIFNRIDSLKVLDRTFDEEIPPVADIFRDTLGSFIGPRHRVRIRFTEDVVLQIDYLLGALDPRITGPDKAGYYEAVFTVSDDMHLCKELFLYGSEVEIVEPKDLRETMGRMLRESMKKYRGK